LKGLTSSGKNTVNIRKSLVVVQFAISIFLIIGTLTVLKQINHVKDRPVNYDKELLVSVPIKSKKIIDEFSSLRTELLKSPYIEEVAASDVTITNTATTNGGFEWKGKDPNFDDSFYTLRSTHGFGEMIDWEIVDGRDFSSNYKSDSLSFIVNETAVKYMNLDNPLGEQIRWGNNGTYTIVGVVKDMVTRSPFDPMVPSIFVLHYGGFLNNVNIKLSGNDSVDKALAGIETVFNRYSPETTFTYNFVDEEYERKFAGAERIASLTSIFSIVAILISCLGVLGLSTFMAIQRKKEIGIRKVLGASVASIWGLLSKQFLILVLIAFGIAIPLGYYYSTNWLEGYAYRTSLDIWTMVIAAVIILGFTFVTVSFQSIKAAISNPIKSLRTE
ncbi:MAG: FtsX-like permease family protein, partial [Flavobacteriaceae bacterium]|nr:FtsX-like permease family protein [Flavobacteriaceae bacterium]